MLGLGTRYEKESDTEGETSWREITGLDLRSPAPVRQVRPWVAFLLWGIKQPDSFIPLSEVVKNWEAGGKLAQDIGRYVTLRSTGPLSHQGYHGDAT